MAERHGGRRPGAGRRPGTNWKPPVTEMRESAARHLTAVEGTTRDPLQICLNIAADETQNVQIRLGAAAIVMPFLYPKLSAAQVDTRTTNINIDAGQLLDRLDERIAKLQPGAVPQLIEAEPEGDEPDGAGGAPPADDPV
jgi:hypothetical protein